MFSLFLEASEARDMYQDALEIADNSVAETDKQFACGLGEECSSSKALQKRPRKKEI